MTLVVGYAKDDFGFLVADSLLMPIVETKFERGPVVGQFHGLKIQIIRPDIAIAFATSNDVEMSLAVCRNVGLSVASGQSAHDIPDRVLGEYLRLKEKNNPSSDCEFLVLQLEKEMARLFHISGGGVRGCQRAYIGDSEEYAELTKLRKPKPAPAIHFVQQPDGSFRTEANAESAGVTEFMEISDAVRLLSQRRRGSVGAIGDCIIRVCKAHFSKELEYLQLHEASVSPWEGSAGYSLLASNSDRRGIAIYYLVGKVGFIMMVGDNEHLRKEYAETKEAFVELVRAKYGLDLQ